MKKTKIFVTTILACVALNSCLEPEEDRLDIPVVGVSLDLNFSVTQQQGYDNVVYLESLTEKVIPFWDYGSGVSNKPIDTILIPFAGNHNIKYYAYTANGPVVDSVAIAVSENDPVFFAHEYWELLTGNGTGKTWVWATDNTEANGNLTGVGPYDPASTYLDDNWNWLSGYDWWQSSDVTPGSLSFDLNGATHLTVYNASAGVSTTGLFSLDTVTFFFKPQGITLLNQEGDAEEFRIARLTENELIFCQIYDWGGQRPYYYKREGYVFP